MHFCILCNLLLHQHDMYFNGFNCRMNMEEHNSSLVVESSYPDLVINVGKVTLGERNRKKLQKIQREQEKAKVITAACALLNSGGGVIQLEMTNNDEHPVEMGQDLEESLRTLILSSNLQDFFKTKQQGRCYYIFVKSWSSDTFPEDSSFKPRICSLNSSLYRRSIKLLKAPWLLHYKTQTPFPQHLSLPVICPHPTRVTRILVSFPTGPTCNDLLFPKRTCPSLLLSL